MNFLTFKFSAGWSEWGEWSECTVSSDYGSRIRYRNCPEDSKCPGKNYEIEECTDDLIYCEDQSITTENYLIICTDKNTKTDGKIFEII